MITVSTAVGGKPKDSELAFHPRRIDHVVMALARWQPELTA